MILTNTKEQSVLIYKRIRELDPQRTLNISRLGSVSIVAPQIELTSAAKASMVDQQALNEVSADNLTLLAENDNLDILIATPFQLAQLSPWSRVYHPNNLVFEDFELLFEEFCPPLERIMGSLDNKTKQIWASRLSSPKISPLASRWFPELSSHLPKVPRGPRVSTRIQHSVEKAHRLSKMEDICNQNMSKRGVILCQDGEDAKNIYKHLSRKQIKAHLYTLGNQTPAPIWHLYNFSLSTGGVLVCEERAVRPLDTLNVDYGIIAYPVYSDDIVNRILGDQAHLHHLLTV